MLMSGAGAWLFFRYRKSKYTVVAMVLVAAAAILAVPALPEDATDFGRVGAARVRLVDFGVAASRGPRGDVDGPDVWLAHEDDEIEGVLDNPWKRWEKKLR